MPEERTLHGGPEAFDREVKGRVLVGLGVGLLLLTIAAIGGIYLLYFAMLHRSQAADPPPPLLEEARAPVTITGPRLLGSPERERQRVQADEDEILTTYGWVDEGAGIARIPVARALELAAEHGLEVASPPTPPPTPPTEGSP